CAPSSTVVARLFVSSDTPRSVQLRPADVPAHAAHRCRRRTAASEERFSMFRIRTALAGAAVAVVALLTVAAPASAHDELVSTSPAFDEQLTTAPEQVVLTFSDDVLQLSGSNGTAMTVVDESGADWVAGDPVISADTVTVPLKSGMPNGDFTVTWKI